MTTTEDSVRDLWDNIKATNIRITRVPEREGKKVRVWEKFWRDYTWKFSHHGKGNIQSSPRGTKSPINPRKNTARCILIKLTKTKQKEKILKAAWKKQQVTYKGNPTCLTADLSAETTGQQDIFKLLKGKNSTTKFTLPGKDLIQKWWRNQSFSDKQKLKEFSTTKPSLQQMLKELI